MPLSVDTVRVQCYRAPRLEGGGDGTRTRTSRGSPASRAGASASFATPPVFFGAANGTRTRTSRLVRPSGLPVDPIAALRLKRGRLGWLLLAGPALPVGFHLHLRSKASGSGSPRTLESLQSGRTVNSSLTAKRKSSLIARPGLSGPVPLERQKKLDGLLRLLRLDASPQEVVPSCGSRDPERRPAPCSTARVPSVPATASTSRSKSFIFRRFQRKSNSSR
jgi:hypothetical protein